MATKPGSNNIKKGKSPKIQHRFLSMREPICTDASQGTVCSMTTGSNGIGTVSFSLCPLGLKTLQYSSSSWSACTVDPPHLRWLQTNSQNFGYYRVTRAKLVFVGNLGTTSTGQLNLFGSKDVADVSGASGLQTAYVQGPYSKTYDLASSGSKELSLNLPVDTSWKKNSVSLMLLASTVPFTGPSSGIVSLNSVNDLCFTAFYAQVVGAPASSTVGNFFLDYDVEFSQPLAVGMNL